MTCKALKTFLGGGCIAAAAMLMATPAHAQCSGQTTPTPNPQFDLAPTQETTIRVVYSSPATVSSRISGVLVNLECANAGGCNLACSLPAGGPAIHYLGDATIVGQTCAPGIASNFPGGTGAGQNSILFTFLDAPGGNPTEITLAAGASCEFSFDVVVADLSGDLTAKVVTGTAETLGVCNVGGTDIPLQACGSYLITLKDPAIQIVKDVDDDDICEGDEVNYDYAVTNIGNADLENVVVVDDNGTPGTGDDFNPTFDPASDVGSDGILSVGETWLYSHGPVSLTVDTTNIATVTGDYVSAAGTVTVTHNDNAIVNVNPPPSCSIDDNPGVCETELCVVTDACGPYTVLWSGPSGFSATTDCITLDANDPAGEYCVRVTDCNGCESGGPGSDCCYTFTPPVAPTCTITVTDCPFPRTLTVHPVNCTNCTFQWGQGTAGSCTPLGGETGSTFVANSPGTFCVTITSDNGCTSSCDLVVEECPTGGHGRTPGFWKQIQHWGHWPAPYCASDDCPCGPATLFCDVFDCDSDGDCQDAVDAAYEGKTLLEVLGQGGGGFYALGRHAVAGLLNSAHNGIDYAYTTAEVIEMVDDAIDDCDPNPTKNDLAENNELGGGDVGGQLFCEATVAGYASTWPDFNNDGKVDGADMGILLDNWGPYTGPCDLHQNNKINNKDVVIMVYLLSVCGD